MDCCISVAGFGYGAISGAFSLVNVLAEMTGPGTVGIYGQSRNFFITSGGITLFRISIINLAVITYN